MLIDFKLKNFRSIYDEMNFSMQSEDICDQEEKLIKVSYSNKTLSILPTKVIFGINASGKTSIVLGLNTLKEIIERGNISTFDNTLAIYHFIHEEESLYGNIHFEITFEINKYIYLYTLEIGNVETEKGFDSYIAYEKLLVNDCIIFERKKDKIKFNTNNENDFKKYIKTTDEYIIETEKILNKNISDKSVFTSWFNLNAKLLDDVYEFFSKKLFILTGLDDIKYTPDITKIDTNNYTKYVNELIFKLAKEADFGPQEINFSLDNDQNGKQETRINSTYEIYNNDKNKVGSIKCDSELIESLGTIKLIKFLGPFVDAISNGMVIVVDELDSSIHAEIIASIVKTFSNREVNKNNAQLIFTTHNPIFLNENLFRKDEIVFVEKSPSTYKTSVFTLADFEDNVGSNYLDNYIEGHYINFANVNFSNIIKKVVDEYEKD